jgi:hypothetical protein
MKQETLSWTLRFKLRLTGDYPRREVTVGGGKE